MRYPISATRFQLIAVYAIKEDRLQERTNIRLVSMWAATKDKLLDEPKVHPKTI